MDQFVSATEGLNGLFRRIESIVLELCSPGNIEVLSKLQELAGMGIDAPGMERACLDLAGWWEAVMPLASRLEAERRSSPLVVDGSGPPNWRDTENDLRALGVDPDLLLLAAQPRVLAAC